MTDEDDFTLQALAEAWASIDGKLSKFRRGKTAKSILAYGGHYAGYIEDARELRERLAARGVKLRKSPPAALLGERG